MKKNRSKSQSKYLLKKSISLQTIISIALLILLNSTHSFSQSHKSGKLMNESINNIQSKNSEPVYLDNNDPIYTSIKGRVINDLKQNADPESQDNKLISEKMKTFSVEKKNEFEALFKKSITNYTDKIHFDVGTLIMFFKVLAEKEMKVLTEEYEIRVQYLGSENYAAEFWVDGLAVNSEEHALVWAKKLALRFPNDNEKETIKDVKETYANARKSINDGETDRYTKVMALLYTKGKNGPVIYHNPFQVMTDLINK